MKVCVQENLTVLEVASPDELGAALDELLRKDRKCSRYLSLVVLGPKVITRQFEYKNIPAQELRDNLLAEASELLSLTTDEIELGFQLLESDPEAVQGIFAAMPRETFRQYLSVLDRRQFLPVKITTYPLAVMEFLLAEHPSSGGIRCFFDLTKKNMIYQMVFKKKDCLLLREVPCEDDNDLEKEVIQTARWAYAKRNGAGLGGVYFFGRSPALDRLTERIAQQFGAKVEQHPVLPFQGALRRGESCLGLNLADQHYCSLSERNLVKLAVNIFLGLSLLLSGSLTLKILAQDVKLKRTRASYSDADYRYAVKLQEQLKKASHAK